MNWVWLAVRLTGIALGIITLLGFASGYLGVEFKPYFKNVLDWLEKHLVDFIVRPEEIEWALDYLRQHFAWVPKPEPQWKYLYTLTALVLMSMARTLIGSGVQDRWLKFPIALVCSLVPAVFAGTMPIGSLATATWPVLGMSVGVSLFVTLRPVSGWQATIVIANIALAAVSAPVLYFGARGENALMLVVPALFVGFVGFAMLVAILLISKGTLWQRLQRPTAITGLEILGTLGGALFLGYLFAA
jgi:hypothetical protein